MINHTFAPIEKKPIKYFCFVQHDCSILPGITSMQLRIGQYIPEVICHGQYNIPNQQNKMTEDVVSLILCNFL
jgi:hypothetical protein